MKDGIESAGFIRRYGLWSHEQAGEAEALKARLAKENLHLVRLAWADPHGAARAKAVSVPVFLDALSGGYNINVATWTLDSANSRVFSSFTRGGGMGLEEMTGSPNLTIVPDPATFRVLPWAPGVGWVLCDEYFRDGRPFHFSSRHLLRRQVQRLADDGMTHVVGLEVEWYLARAVQEQLTAANVGLPGRRGQPIETAPVEPGFSYHSETNLDLMQPVLSELALAYGKLGLSLRSMENEWGPSQVECTFTPADALTAADDMLLFRTATRQVCRRLGYFATFMCRPALAGHYASGWHLHQSISDREGRNLFTSESPAFPLSATGQSFLSGLLAQAAPSTIFATPTVNGYRRFKRNSLAPDRAAWAVDHRGAMLRVLGEPGDAAARIENRSGEPAANPYLFMASQIAAGRYGMARAMKPGPADDEPYDAPRPMLPATLGEALAELGRSELFRREFGDTYIDYYLKLKGMELERFRQFCRENALDEMPEDVTQWEQNEYYDFF